MPDGMDRNEALAHYAVETGVTLRKAEEHLELLETTGMLRCDDLRLYTTPKGLRWAGFIRDEKGDLLDVGERAEERHRERTSANAQKAPVLLSHFSSSVLPRRRPLWRRGLATHRVAIASHPKLPRFSWVSKNSK